MNWIRLKKEFEERPLEFTAVVTAAVIAVTKVVDVVSSARSKNAYARNIRKNLKKK